MREIIHLMGFPPKYEVPAADYNVLCQGVPTQTAKSICNLVSLANTIQFYNGLSPRAWALHYVGDGVDHFLLKKLLDHISLQVVEFLKGKCTLSESSILRQSNIKQE